MLFNHNTNPEIQRAFAEVISLMSSTLQLSVHTVYKGEKKREEKMWVLQTSCLEIVLPIYYKLMQGFCLNNQKKLIFTEQPFFYKIIDQMLLSVIPC